MYHRAKINLIKLSLLMLQLSYWHSAYCLPNIGESGFQANEFEDDAERRDYEPPHMSETIDEVQKILAEDPTLPRLTRGEIEELYEKVTREEYENSLRAGDRERANSMRALMLVLPYNTDNNTEENLQELYTRQPVTKVIENYNSHEPIKFITPNPNTEEKLESVAIGQMDATTYKPHQPARHTQPSPTTYHPTSPPAALYKPSAPEGGFRPVTNLPPSYDYRKPIAINTDEVLPKVAQRYSSHYSAKNAEFLRRTPLKSQPSTTTVRPVADVLEGLGIVRQSIARNRYTVDEYYPAESAPKPVISPFSVSNISPKIQADAYASFKPLNIGEELRVQPEVEDYLTRFGIVNNRKRKALKKEDGEAPEQQAATSDVAMGRAQSEPATKVKKSSQSSDAELDKLLQHLQQLQNSNGNARSLKSVATTTTSTTATAPSTTPDLITNGVPMLIEAKKPKRRIDPNLDINFGTAGNHEADQNNADQLQKLLENLQELEKLHINPKSVLKSVAPAAVKTSAKTTTTTTTIRTPIVTQLLVNRFSALSSPTTKPISKPDMSSAELEHLKRVLQQLEARQKTSTSSTSSTTRAITKAPSINSVPSNFDQLRKLLSDDRELERLYEQARGKKAVQNPATTTSTTKKPTAPSLEDLEELRKYFATLDRSTTSSTTTITTTTSTTKPPSILPKIATPRPQEFAQRIAASLNSKPRKPSVEQDQLQELIQRVQQLERQTRRSSTEKPKLDTTTPESTQQFMGFTSRNVKSTSNNEPAMPSNDFAHLQELYKQVQEAEKAVYGQVEISTAASGSKLLNQTAKRTQQLLDITNDSGTGSSLGAVDPDEYVHLQKLISKVQELERVKITADGKIKQSSSSISFKTSTTVPPTTTQRRQMESSSASSEVSSTTSNEISLLDYTTVKTLRHKPLDDLSSSEELRELVLSSPVDSSITKTETEQQKNDELFDSLEDAERNAYRNMQPAMITKTITKEPQKKKSQDILDQSKQADLAELQKLLNNAQELKKLGISLPTELTQQIETNLAKTGRKSAGFKSIALTSASQEKTSNLESSAEIEKYLTEYGIIENVAEKPRHKNHDQYEKYKQDKAENEPVNAKTVVFSLTAARNPVSTEIKSTTESTADVPVFSATKIIEDAIKRAANRIGVSTERAQGFQKRMDTNVDEVDDSERDDLMAEFSEFNYQMVMPPESDRRMDEDIIETKVDSAPNITVAPMTMKTDLTELQRLIGNIKELQRLNITTGTDLLRVADKTYLESQKTNQTTETNHKKRQSAVITSTTAANITANTTTSAPTRVNLGLSLGDDDLIPEAAEVDVSKSSTTSTTAATIVKSSATEESRNGPIADLENSFGPDPNTETPLPPKKKNGFYFLADWNSFLEVGEGEQQVVVRFSPKIGDPRLFLPVKVP